MSRLIGVQEAAEYINLSTHTLYTMVSQQRVPHVKMGRLVKFNVELLDKWIKEHTKMPMPPRTT
jgi:excisionase family DNA binding protein